MIVLAVGRLLAHRSALKFTPVHLNASGPGVQLTWTRPCGIDRGACTPLPVHPRRASWKIIYNLGFPPPREYYGIIIAAYPGKFARIVQTEWSQGEDRGYRPDAVRGLQLLRRDLSGKCHSMKTHYTGAIRGQSARDLYHITYVRPPRPEKTEA